MVLFFTIFCELKKKLENSVDDLNRIIGTSKEKHNELGNKAEEITQNAEKINVRSLETQQNGKIYIKLEFLKS